MASLETVPVIKKKRKKEEKLEFEAGKVFVSSKSKELGTLLSEEASRYKARSGQGGDRRA